MPRYRSYSRGYHSTRNYGAERAREHIEAAQRLTAELGGNDKYVKAWFFALSPIELNRVLNAYGKAFGKSPQEYAEQAIPKWRSGQVQMGGMVAERLFKLLPPFMPLELKYKLTEGLWDHFGPSSKKVLWIGIDADIDTVRETARAHFADKVSHFKIPASMEARFNWIADDDVGVKQELLNHLRDMEKRLVSDALTVQLPVLFEHLLSDKAGHTKRMAQILKVGKHELELVIDKAATGIQENRPVPEKEKSSWLFWVSGAIILILFFLLKR